MAPQTSFSPSSFSSSSRSFSSSSISYVWKYHVFLSFRGPDTRHGFIGHLHKALSDKGIHTFIDDEELQRGEEITPSLAKAIEESRIAIPVFSENYASSAFCLDELVKIMECVKGKGRLVLPVFYKVDPCNVRYQRGSYSEAFTRHEERFKDDIKKVQRWRAALHQAANLSGEHFNLGNEYECDFIVKIVKEISKRISRVLLHVANYPVGLESRVLEVNRLLNDGSECGVHMVGIYGIGGMGKTTLAKAVYNSVADQFESLCFIENMSELVDRHGLVYLQEMVLSKILGDKVCNLGSVGEGISIIKERFCHKKILLILDNVDKREHLQAIVESLNGLGSGSRVIITTRNKHLLTTHKVKKVYEVGILNEKDAIELFSRNAFEFGKGEPCYMDILKKLVTYASGLPLALELIGSNLFGKSVKEWRSALDVYKKIPNNKVQEKLKVSFDGLHPIEKEFFLDIACCFKGYELREVVDILHVIYDVDPTYSIRVLVDKSLIKINNGFHNPIILHGVITLHDLIQDMGREIVRLESPMKPGTRSRLCLAKDIVEVLQEDKGTSNIELINLECDYNGDVIQWDGLAFRKMENLQTLIIKNGRFSQGPKYLPSSLRVIKWEIHSSEKYSQICFHPKQLVRFNLSRSCFDSVLVAELFKKECMNLSVLKFDECERITKIPNLSSAPQLEVLSFRDCRNLTEVDKSVGSLDNLKNLDANGCSQLRSLPPLMLPYLEYLDLQGCSSLECFPEILGKMEGLEYLDLSDSASLKKLPYSIHNLTRLHSFSMINCGIVELPNSIMLLKVESLWFGHCKGLLFPNQEEGEEQASSMPFSNSKHLHIGDCNISEEFLRRALLVSPNLQSLTLKGENFRILPDCVGEFQNLMELYLIDCEKLEEIRGIPPNIKVLLIARCTSLSPLTRRILLNKKLHEEGQDNEFVSPGKRLPMWFEHQTRGTSITFWFRNKFPAISFGFFYPSEFMKFMRTDTDQELTINGAKSFQFCVDPMRYMGRKPGDHIYILNKTQTSFRDEVDEALSENEWNRAVFSFCDNEADKWIKQKDLDGVTVGVHIIKEKSCMDDVRFTNPLSQKECDTFRSTTSTLNVEGEDSKDALKIVKDFTTNVPFTNPSPLENTKDNDLGNQRPLLDNELCELQQLPSLKSNIPTTCEIVESTEEDWHSLPPPPPSVFYSNVNWDSKQISSTTTTLNVQGSDADSWMYDKEWRSLPPCWQESFDCDNLESNLMQPASHNIMVQESSQAPSHVKTQNIQVPFPTSSGAIVCGEEPHLETCCTVFPTTIEESLRNQVEQSQEHVQMESSLDAGGTHVLSHSHDHSSTTATSEDSKDALKLVQDFATNIVPFTYPDPLKNTEDNGLCEVQQLLLLKSNIPPTCEPVECTEEEEDWLSLPPSLDDVSCSSNSGSDSEPQSLVGSHVEQPLDDAYNNSDSVQSASAIHSTNGLPKKCIVLFLCLLLIVVSLFGSAMWRWCFHHNDILTGTSLQEHQRLISINQHNLEGCESVNKAKGKGMAALTCNSNAAEDDGKKPITENLSTTKAVSGSYESSFHSENVDQLVNSLTEIQAPSPQPLDPLAELERILIGAYDLPPESSSHNAASSSDIQASEVVIILQNLEPLLDNPLESLIANGEIKHQILDCLSKLGLLEDHIPIPLQSIVAQVRDFYEDLIHSFPSIQQTLVDYSCLEDTRSKFLENLNQAKAKQARIDAEVLRGKVQVEELDTEIADLEIKLKAAVEKRNELKLAIKNGEAEKNKLLKDATAWLMESKQVVEKIKGSEHAYRDAQNSKARLEGRLATLKGALAANNNKR